MVLLLLLVLIALPVVELAVIVQVAGEIGVLDTLVLLVLVSMIGVWLAKRAGLGVVRRFREAQLAGRVPDREAADGALVALGGLLLLLPGFVSDVMGILLLIPPTRAAVRTIALRHVARRSGVVVVGRTRGRGDQQGATEVWDVESWEETPPDHRRGQIGDGS